MYNATVEYETKKGNLKTANFAVEAPTLEAATRKAEKAVKTNKLRQCRRVTTTKVIAVGNDAFAHHARATHTPRRRGLFSRLFRRDVRG